MDSFSCRYNMNSNYTKLEQVVHTHRTSHREGLLTLIPVLTPEYLLPSQWIVVLALTYSLPPRSEYRFTLHKSHNGSCITPICVTEPTRYTVYDAPLSRSARRRLSPLQKSRRNHYCYMYVWTEAPSGIVFGPAQKLSGIAWTKTTKRFVWKTVRYDLEHKL